MVNENKLAGGIKTEAFCYQQAFAINTGLLSAQEQQRLKDARVTILGMFAGGTIAHMLARSGVEHFTLIDEKQYLQGDINRDIGCCMDTIGEYKAEVIAAGIKRINPFAVVQTITRKLDLQDLPPFIQSSDVYFAQSDDIAYSCHSLILAQELNKCAITCMPSGFTGYVEVYPPGIKKIIDPAALFGSPPGLSYKKLYYFLRNPLNRCGRRWHITEGKWRIKWFKQWRDGKVVEAQLCPNVWLSAALASIEAVKYLTGKWPIVAVPYMWHPVPAENRIKIQKFRRRSWWFERIVTRIFDIGLFGAGRAYRKFTSKRLINELDIMQGQENEGKQVKYPFIWKHFI